MSGVTYCCSTLINIIALIGLKVIQLGMIEAYQYKII